MNQKEVLEFPTEVINELKNYVYRLIDPRNGETFYVGKGKGNRVFQHMKCALDSKDLDELSEKLQVIRDITKAGLDVIHVIHRHGLDKDCVLDVEAALIDAYPGTTNIIGGHGCNDYCPMNASEIVQKYATQEIIFKHDVLMITVNRSLTDRSIYDATRFAWRIDKKKAEKVEVILAVEKGIVIEVFIAKSWKEATIQNFPKFDKEVKGRWGFEGIVANEEVRNIYIRKRIPSKFRKKGASNPIKYRFE